MRHLKPHRRNRKPFAYTDTFDSAFTGKIDIYDDPFNDRFLGYVDCYLCNTAIKTDDVNMIYCSVLLGFVHFCAKCDKD